MKFATLFNFTEQGIENIEQSPERAAAFSKQAEKFGLKISEMLWLTGRFFGLIVFDAPDAQNASAAMLQLGKAGNVKTETLLAFDVESMNRVIEKI
jgi:uncharacterized protein with GYD domain